LYTGKEWKAAYQVSLTISFYLCIVYRKALDTDNPLDFVDILLVHLKEGDAESRLTMEQVLYELEDFIGGHSAVANLLVRALIEIAGVPGLSQKIYETVRGDSSSESFSTIEALYYKQLLHVEYDTWYIE